jgi:CRP-like cAMP-binding protein
MTSANQSLAKFFQSLPLQAMLTKDEEVIIGSLSSAPKYYPPRTILSHQGDSESRLFIINSGWACNYKDLPNGERQVIDFPLKGDIVGIRAVEGPSYDSLASVTELSTFEVSRAALQKALNRVPKLSQFILGGMARQHSVITEHLTNAGRRTAVERLGHYLLELNARLASVGECDAHGFDCPLTQQELADALGVTAIHINRTLRDLRNHNLALFRSGVVEFPERAKLVKLVGFDADYLRLPTFAVPALR